MANKEHIARLLDRGPGFGWNGWRKDNPNVKPDFSGADLAGKNISGAREFESGTIVYTEMNLSEADFSAANLSKAELRGADLKTAQLTGTDLTEAFLGKADLTSADLCSAKLRRANLESAKLHMANLSSADLRNALLTGADLSSANLENTNICNADLRQAKLFKSTFRGANLTEADLSEADVRETTFAFAIATRANFQCARFIHADFREADLSQAAVFGISAWGLNLEGANQRDLVITRIDEPIITVDNLEVAQFIYMILNNEKIRDVIDTITSKVVLVLGRFTLDRKMVLDAIREELRRRNYLPVLFDFNIPANRDITETISTLAHMARFVIADITEARSIPQELQAIVPFLPSVPIKPLIQKEGSEYGMFEHFKNYPWVLKVYEYQTVQDLISSLGETIIDPAEEKARELISNRL